MNQHWASQVVCWQVVCVLGACNDGGRKPEFTVVDAAQSDDAGHMGDDASVPSGDAAVGDAGLLDASATDGALTEDATAGDAGNPVSYWYDSKQPVSFALTAAFGDAFRAAYAGTPDGIVPPVRNKEPFIGNASYVYADGKAHAESLNVSVRGNSSLQECAFPKLKLAYEKRATDTQHPFFDTKKLKIGTHCGEEDTVNGTIGRLRNERAAWREEVVYQLARALGITIMQTRPATLHYVDTSVNPAFTGPLVRKAFLLEHVDELARRLGATALADPVDCGDDPSARPSASDVLRVKFFHAMIGNWDWLLGPPETNGCGSLMNTEVLVFPDGSLTLVPADFDLAAFVVGEVRNERTNQMEAITADNAKASARAYLTPSLVGESAPSVAAMKAEYRKKYAILLKVVDDSQMDAEGKAAARLLLDGFFDVLSE